MMTLNVAAKVCGGERSGADAMFSGVSIDTRTLRAGDLYVAIKGDKFDGHDFIPQAAQSGARGALVEKEVKTALPLIRVARTRQALGDIAKVWRERFAIPVVAVTGSNGKTTVKEMLAAVLAGIGTGCVTRGNLNNDIGLPLTLLRLRETDRYLVCEMGMNHLREIEYLSSLARPTVAIITNAGHAHLAGVGGLEQVACAKGEILSGLRPEGTAVLNADDPHFSYWRDLVPAGKVKSFALDNSADVTAKCTTNDRGLDMQIDADGVKMRVALPLLGRHNALNALAAIAAARVLGIDAGKISAGLAAMRPVAGRLELKPGREGARVIDDTYNANPDSLRAAVEVLKDFSGERVLVLGDMAELGDTARALHERAGEYACAAGIEHLYALGELSAVTVAKFGKRARHFTDRGALIDALSPLVRSGTTVLVKGSRVMRMEEIVGAITTSPVKTEKH